MKANVFKSAQLATMAFLLIQLEGLLVNQVVKVRFHFVEEIIVSLFESMI